MFRTGGDLMAEQREKQAVDVVSVRQPEYGVAEYEKAIRYIYDLIQDGTLQLGSRLPTERAIAQTLGIGRNSTREALCILHGMGLVERVQGSGNYISKNVGGSIRQTLLVMLALGTITRQQVCEFRRVMETSVCQMLLQKGMPQEYQKRCEELLRDMEAQDGDQLVDTDQAFHDTLIEATQNGLLLTIMEAVTQVYREWIDHVLQKTDAAGKRQFLDCHREIYAGLKSGDAKMMQAAIDCHYDMIEEML